MQNYKLKLESEVSTSFRCQKAANSLDIDVEKKSVHEIEIDADITTKYNVGLIVGASGSGKTTLAKHIFASQFNMIELDQKKPIIEQFPESYSYDECAEMLSGVGLTSVPCWIRPVYTLSNGQKARAEAAIAMSKKNDVVVIDEWTSVVDRTVAKVMSQCVTKHARKKDKKLVLLSCHYDVIEWLDPDWIIDCNTQKFIDRRLLSSEERRRKEQLNFEIKEVDRSTWKNFSKYHYLSENLPAGKIYNFGLFCNGTQIGFQCYANYVPIRKGMTPIFHFNRTVVHPDYAGMGLGIKMINATSLIMQKKYAYKLMGKFSSIPVAKALLKKNSGWKLLKIKRQLSPTIVGGNMLRKTGFRENVKIYCFEFVGLNDESIIVSD